MAASSPFLHKLASFSLGPFDTVNSDAPASEFTPFSRLPPELRDQIWKFYIKDNPHVIEIRPHASYPHEYLEHFQSRFLNISRTLREQAFITYGFKKIKAYRHIISIFKSEEKPTHLFAFHPDVDVLYVPDITGYVGRTKTRTALSINELDIFRYIATLVVGNNCLADDHMVLVFVMRCQHLKSLVVCLDDSDDALYSESVHLSRFLMSFGGEENCREFRLIAETDSNGLVKQRQRLLRIIKKTRRKTDSLPEITFVKWTVRH